MDFYETVKALVKEKTSLNLRPFIEGLGINYETYSSTRRYGNLPRADDARKIASTLGTTVEELVDGEAGVKYVREWARNAGGIWEPPNKIADIVADLLVLDETDLTGIRAAAHALAVAKRGEKTGTDGPNG
jgi:hypothetical protein